MNQNRLVELFTQMAEINSPSKNERAMADFLIERFKKIGVDVEEDDAGVKTGGNAGNLIARLQGNVPGAPFFLCSHMDTVQPTDGLKPVIRDEVIRTDGTTILGSDDKAGITAILGALEKTLDENVPHPEIEVLLTVQEETGSWGCRNLDTGKLRSRMGFVLDSGGSPGEMVSETPTLIELEITVLGKAAHSGVEPEKGINAIWLASRALARLPVGKVDRETAFNIGVIQGGQAVNMVPDQVKLRGEIRGFDPEKIEQLYQRIERVFLKTAQSHGCQAELRRRVGFSHYKLSEKDPVIQMAFKAARRAGLHPGLVPRGGGSDANIFNERGIPCANLAVGMTDDHSTQEHIRVEDLVNAAELVYSLVAVSANGGAER